MNVSKQKVVKVKKGSTPFEILQSYGTKKQKADTFVSRISVEKKNQHQTYIADLNDLLHDNCHLEFVTSEDQEAKRVIWNSSSIIVGSILSQYYQALLHFGMTTDNG